VLVSLRVVLSIAEASTACCAIRSASEYQFQFGVGGSITTVASAAPNLRWYDDFPLGPSVCAQFPVVFQDAARVLASLRKREGTTTVE
jgi:hypothetical protein